jgi:RHS repeat-associated protein
MVYEPTYAGGVLQLFITYIADYFPYGKVLREYVNTGSGAERFLTTQHERDKETGLDYRGARFYDSDISRFLSLDPLATEFPAWSAYNYVMGNPISLIDPTGRSPEGTGNGDKDKKKKEETPASLDPERGGDFESAMVIEQGLDYGGMFKERNDKMLNDAVANLTGNSKDIADASTIVGYVGTVISTAGEVMKTRSTELYRQGFRQGLSGNYQLTGSNLSRFNSLPAKPYTLPSSGIVTWGKRFGNAGTIIGVGTLGVDTYLYSQGKMSGMRYTYHVGTFGTSLGTGIIAGGPAGLLVGGVLTTGEAGYDASKKVKTEMKQSYNRFYNNMINNFLRFR